MGLVSRVSESHKRGASDAASTREVNRDDRRLRGVQIAEPVLWRWMGMAATRVITTGLSIWSTSRPATILPRGPIGVARPVAPG